jgi:archaellum component FlaC
MIAFDRTYESGNNKKYYRCGNSLAKYREAKKNGHIPTDIVAHKAENAVWNWLKELLLDPTSLEKGLHEMIESRAEKVDPKQKQLESIARLMEEEEQKIKRLVTEMGKYDDNFVLVTFRNEIEQATKNYNSLKKEYESISNELHQIELTNEQQDYIMNFAEKIKSRLELANDVEKRAILDILNVKVLLHHDNVGRWLEISCAIPAYNDAIAFNPQEALFP